MVSTRNSPFQDFEKVNPEYNSGTQRIGDESLYLSLFSLDRSSEHQVPSRKVGEIDEPMKVFTSSKSSSAEKLRAAEDLKTNGKQYIRSLDGHWHEAATGKVLDVLIEGNTVRIKE